MENLNNKINTLTFTEFNEALNNNKVKEIYPDAMDDWSERPSQ